MEKEIAIIIPAYNAHNTIERLLFSILNQSIKDICRVYLIDDCSEKDYFYLIDKFPWLDMVICRLDENCGPGTARNKGLELVIEDNIPYIVFADADDLFLGYTSIEVLYLPMKEKKYDRVEGVFATEYVLEDGKKNCLASRDNDIWIFAKIYSTSLIKENNIFFPPTSANEDVAFNALYILYCKNNYLIQDVIYLWKDTPNSLTRKDLIGYGINSFEPLIKGLAHVLSTLDTQKVGTDRVKSFIINRTMRLYFEYINITLDDQRKEFLHKWTEPLRYYYITFYKPIEDEITTKDLMIEWNELTENLGNIPLPLFGYPEFIKKISAV